MDRQRSIRSFFQKPPPPSSASPLSDRPAQPVSAIMRKFLKDDHRKPEGHFDSKNSTIGSLEAFKGLESAKVGKLETDPLGSIIPNTGNNMNATKHIFPDAGFHPDAYGPETRPMQPLVPRLKRIKGDECDNQEKSFFIMSEPSKKMRSLRETCSMEKEQKALFQSPVSRLEWKSQSSSKGMNSLPKTGSLEKEPKALTLSPEITGSKFQWLNPSSIRDANGRRPDDPLHDRRTLYIPHEALSKMSASQKQYWEVKQQYMDIVLFFKVGKFYELYELDAEIGQKELDWKMTISGVGKCRQVGISESGIDDAIQKLIARGYKVGRIEQLETSEQAKSRGASSVIQRKLVQVCCPSTTSDGSMGADAIHLLALKEGNWVSGNNRIVYGFAFLDYAELKLWSGFIRDDSSYSALGALLVQITPKEIVYESQGLSKDTLKAIKKYASTGCCSMQLTPIPGLQFLDASEVRKLITTRQYFSGSFESWISTIDCKVDLDLALCALGGLVDHVTRLKLDDVLRNGGLSPYHIFKYGLKMDGQTLVNLEIFNNNIDGSSSGTLYKYLDHCLTPYGKRLLRKWICNPLKSVSDINERLNVVEGIFKNPGIISVISEYLRRLPDLERLLGRIKASVGSEAVLVLPTIGEKLLKQQVKSFGSLIKGLRVGMELLKILYEEGSTYSSFFRAQNLPDLCKLDDFLNQFEVAIDDVFPHYQDPDVKDTDAETLSALIEPFIGKMPDWSQVIHALSCIDVLLAFAVTANSSGGSMSRPVFLPVSFHSSEPGQVNRARVLEIKGLRHPYAMVESGGPVVPNDICLGGEISDGCNPRTLLLTGPNMGGKSTLLRATCLSVILAQLGCLVPCDSCVLSLVDVIFTRLGAVDRIMSGESTFFIECAETASILRNATEDSLVLLDELGRGTSTFDGYAIAYAVFRHLIEKVHCRLLFATHYHPLTKEFASHPLVSLQHMACALRPRTSGSTDGDQELFFLYQLTSGACPESYGLQVALMAGIPSSVVEAASRARETMKAMIGNNFKSSEMRSKFSSYHEECLKSLLEVSRIGDCADEDCFDTMLCLWHEVKSLCREKPIRQLQ